MFLIKKYFLKSVQFEKLIVHASSVVSDSFMTPWTAAHQASLFMGISKQEYWNGLQLPSPGDLLNSGIEPQSPVSFALVGGFLFFLSFFFFFFLTTQPPGKPKKFIMALLNEYFITSYILEALVILEGYLTWQMKQFIMILVLCQFFQFFSFRINDTMFLGNATIDYKCILSR